MSYVTEPFFDVLGVPVALGRPLLEDDHRLRQRNAVISDGLWRTRWAATRGDRQRDPAAR
jgi:hypothetical protein